jgi:hypothetical protein
MKIQFWIDYINMRKFLIDTVYHEYGMQPFNSDEVNSLYYIALGNEESMINDSMRTAVSMLTEFAGKGDTNAIAALETLHRKPSLHPHLQEIIRESRK